MAANLRQAWCGSCSELDTLDNFPFFNNNSTIDFPFIATNTTPAVKNAPEETETHTEGTEFIDMKSLVIPNLLPTSQQEVTDDHQSMHRDREVLFVKEYKQRKGSLAKSMAERPPPRRNPKRQAQLKKPLRVSPSNNFKEITNTCNSSKETTRKTKSSLKQWPVDGMHEKPHFNPVTKRLEKLPGLSMLKRRRRKKPHDEGGNEDFATCAHHNLHYVLMYVNNVKEYNAWTNADKQDNVVKAADILKDACVMYCIANDVSETSLVKYLDDLSSQENISDFLKNVLETK